MLATKKMSLEGKTCLVSGSGNVAQYTVEKIVAVSGLEMAQNSMRTRWTREEIDQRLRIIMKSIYQTCLDASAEYGIPGNYFAGANIAGFLKVVNAMLDQGLV
jgi:glutamate dehydrogenase (NADP+)